MNSDQIVELLVKYLTWLTEQPILITRAKAVEEFQKQVLSKLCEKVNE